MSKRPEASGGRGLARDDHSPSDHDSTPTATTDGAPGQGSGDVTPIRPAASEGWRLELE